MSIQLLDSHYPWLARHGGFARLPSALRLNGCEAAVIAPRRGFLARPLGKLYSTWRRYPPRDQASALSEWEFLLRMRLSGSAGHVLFLEEHLDFLAAPRNGHNWIGTIHLPRRCWNPSALDRLRNFRAITVLCDYLADQFVDIIDAAQIRVLPYGVDAGFFTPAETVDETGKQTLIFIGAWLRNTEMLARLVPEILRRFPSVRFDFIVPLHARGDQAIRTLLAHPSVTWHHNLSDEELRRLYRQATAMVLPMDDSGANTAVVEALACGLPIVTTDVGGIRSYGGGSVFPVVDNNDDASFLDLVAAYLTDKKLRSSVARNSREFVERRLDWPVAAKEYISAYQAFGLL